MTNIRALNQYENQLAFEMLDSVEYNPQSQATVKNVKLDLNETADDTVMLVGENIDVNAKEGNNTVYVSGKNNVVHAGDGTNIVALWGESSTAITGDGNDFMYLEGTDLSATSGKGNNVFRVYGDKNFAVSGSGNSQVGVLGDGNKVVLAKGNHKIGFYGDNNQIVTGKGNSSVMTLDFAIMKGDFEDMEDRWVEKLDHYNTSEKTVTKEIYDYAYTHQYYAALTTDLDFANETDLTELTSSGQPKYVIAGDKEGYAVVYQYSYTYGGHHYYYPRGKEGDQSAKVAIDTATLQDNTVGKYEFYTMKYFKNYTVDGVSGNLIALGDGDNTLKYTVRDNTNDVGLGKATYGHKLEQQTEYILASTSTRDNWEYKTIKKPFYTAG